MPDYKEMYLILFRAAEQATDILIKAQRECEELYIRQSDTELVLLPKLESGENKNISEQQE